MNSHLPPIFANIVNSYMRPLAQPVYRSKPDPDSRAERIAREVDEAMRNADYVSDALQENPRLPIEFARLIVAADERYATLTVLERALCDLIRERLGEGM